jgi:hypothetical protein
MNDDVVFPISVKFEDGTIETYDDVDGLETDLEVFDSDVCTDCEVRDFLGRRVRIKVGENLVLEKLSRIDKLET